MVLRKRQNGKSWDAGQLTSQNELSSVNYSLKLMCRQQVMSYLVMDPPRSVAGKGGWKSAINCRDFYRVLVGQLPSFNSSCYFALFLS